MRRSRPDGLTAVAVLSGNRNFEGRVHPAVRGEFLASPPLVVAYALAGSVLIDLDGRAARRGCARPAVYLRDYGRSAAKIDRVIAQTITRRSIASVTPR